MNSPSQEEVQKNWRNLYREWAIEDEQNEQGLSFFDKLIFSKHKDMLVANFVKGEGSINNFMRYENRVDSDMIISVKQPARLQGHC